MKYFAVLLAILLLAGASMASVGTGMSSGTHTYISADDSGCDGGVCPLPPDNDDDHGCDGGVCPLPPDDNDHGDGHGCDGGVCPLPDNG